MSMETASSYTSAGLRGTSRDAEGFLRVATGQGTQLAVQQDMTTTAFATLEPGQPNTKERLCEAC